MREYRVREGVERVNGARVPPSRIVRLADAAARYELDQGKIEPLPDKPADKPRKSEKPDA